MNPTKMSPEDPRLTAYALGELDAEESARVEESLRNDPAAQAVVAEIRALSTTLEVALADEPIAAGTASQTAPVGAPVNVVRFPHYWVGGLAAACFAVLFVLRPTPAPKAPVASVPQEATAAVATLSADPAVAAVDVAKFRKLPSDSLPEVNPSPALEDGLMLGRTVVSNETAPAASSDPDSELPSDEASQQLLADSRGTSTAVDALPIAPVETSKALAASKSDSLARRNRSLSPSLEYGLERSRPPQVYGGAAYAMQPARGFLGVAGYPLSNVSLKVGSESYGNVRRFLQSGRLPPPDAVRIEEMLNHFAYTFTPSREEAAMAASVEVAAAPWNPLHRLVRIGLKGSDVQRPEGSAANLVFLVDVSGSMANATRLPMVKDSLRELVETLGDDHRVALVAYAGTNQVVLGSTPVTRKAEILSAIDSLEAGGAADAAPGIRMAYEVAQTSFLTGGNNRVILCSDGDFSLGGSERDTLRLIDEKAHAGVSLAVMGFGLDSSYNAMLEKMASRGRGVCSYVDSRSAANQLLALHASKVRAPVASDVKLQVEFNPERAKSYRLIGYEDAVVARNTSRNGISAGDELPAGHVVTALYEVVPVGASESLMGEGDSLRYAATDLRLGSISDPKHRELLTLKVRYKVPTVDVSRNLEIPLIDPGTDFSKASKDFKFAAAVAGFGMLLQESPHKGSATYEKVLAWAEEGEAEGEKQQDTSGRRTEFIDLVKKAKSAAVE